MLAPIMLYKKQSMSRPTFLTQYIFRESIMYAKFPFYSVAQLYALSLNTPVAIMLGGDQLYWVVDQHNENEYMKNGCALLSHAC